MLSLARVDDLGARGRTWASYMALLRGPDLRCTRRAGYDAHVASLAYGTGKLQEALILLYNILFVQCLGRRPTTIGPRREPLAT